MSFHRVVDKEPDRVWLPVAERCAYWLERERSSVRYRSAVDELRAGIAGVKGRLIALDIEGTLTSKTLPDHLPKGIGRWLLQRYSPEERFWAQRPLAKELIEVLVEQKNRVLLWTVANMPTAREILKTSGLSLPDKVQLLAKEHTRKVMTDRRLLGKTLRLPNGEEAKISEKVKLPSLFGVEALLDDQGERWHRPFVEVIEPENCPRIVTADAFLPMSIGELRRASTERGLLASTKRLAAALSC